MNSKERPLPNPSYTASLSELEYRAQSLECALEIEFSITQGQNCDEGSFQEGGSFIATFTPFPKEIEMLEEYEQLSTDVEVNNDLLNSWRVIKHDYNDDFTVIVSEQDIKDAQALHGVDLEEEIKSTVNKLGAIRKETRATREETS